MTRKGDKFTFNGKELTLLYWQATARIRDITDNHTNEQMMKLCKKEIELLEQITETL